MLVKCIVTEKSRPNSACFSQDYGLAVKFYRKAANQGLADAQCNLAFMYYNGQGVSQDYERAVGWYKRAAKQGNANAERALKFFSAPLRVLLFL